MTISHVAMANFRRLRKQRGWTTQHLVEELRAIGCTTITRHTIDNLERPARSPRMVLDDAVWLARVFAVPLEVLVDAAACPSCQGKPPAWFTCNACGLTQDAP